MNIKIIFFSTLIILSPLAFADNSYQISAEKFIELSAMDIGTMSYYEYIGVQNGKAILIHHQMSSLNKSWSQTKYWVPTSELPKELLQSLGAKSGKNI